VVGGKQLAFLLLENDAAYELCQRCRGAKARDHLVLTAGPAKVGAAIETRVDVLAGQFFNRIATVEYVKLDAALLATQTHRHEAALVFQRTGRNGERKSELPQCSRQGLFVRELAAKVHVHFGGHGGLSPLAIFAARAVAAALLRIGTKREQTVKRVVGARLG